MKNKLDSVRAKAKKVYQDVRRKTSTGVLVENDFDLEVSIAPALSLKFVADVVGSGENVLRVFVVTV